MIKRITISEKNNIDAYLDENYYKSLYLYLNYYKYGLNGNKINIYEEVEDNNIKSILLKYGNTIHVLAKDDNDIDIIEIKDLFNELNCKMLCATEQIIKQFYEVVDKSKFELEIGNIRELINIDKEIDKENIYKVSGDELLETSDLVLKDPDIANTYTREELYNQMRDRNDDGYSRDYVLRLDGKMVAHAGTGAENDKIAVINYIIVDPEYRRRGYAYKLVKVLCNDLIKEGKKCYLINYTDESTKLYDKIGFKFKCKYGKCYLRKDDSND